VLDLELLEAVRGVQDELARLPFLLSEPASAAPAQRRRRSAASNGGGTAGERLVATARGSMLHRPDCAVVHGREDLRDVDGTGADLQPCQLCDPLGAQRSRT
jgi:hypothetical protein